MQNIEQERAGGQASGQEKKQDKLPMLQAILLCKCPRCTEGDMFKTGALDMARFNELKEQCPVCDLRFQIEPGFYQLSLYFTYAVSVALIAVFGLAAYLLFNDPPLWIYYIAIFTPLILSTPWNVRYSKVMMLYMFGNVWRSE